MKSKGISPVIATVLLILVAVAIVAIIATWALTMTDTTTESADTLIEDMNLQPGASETPPALSLPFSAV